jgi:SAM-dependent MidA family methyltransferase
MVFAAVVEQGDFVPRVTISNTFGTFLAASLVAFGEVQVLGGEV